jgi:hypothetical protein
MSESKGVKDLTDVIDLALAAVNVVQSAKKDGHIGVEDLGLVLQLIPLAGPALDGVGQIPAELKDLSAEEAAQVVAHLGAKLGIEDSKAMHIAEAALKVAASGYSLVKAIQE